MVGPGWNQALGVDVGRRPVVGRGLEAFPLHPVGIWELCYGGILSLHQISLSGFCLLGSQQREMTRRPPCG